jgi:hypothetical protein
VKVLTANRFTDGAVVYLGGANFWTRTIDDAARLEPAAAAAALAEAQDVPSRLVGPYLIDADEAGATGRERLRETIRASGPTVGHSLKAERHVSI